EDGQTVHYSGQVDHNVTFAYLLERHYIPMTHPVLTGAAPYEPAQVFVEGGAAVDASDFADAKIASNYHIISLRVTLTDSAGKTAYTGRRVLTKTYFNNGTAFLFPVSNLPTIASMTRDLTRGETYRCAVEVLVATGQTFTPIQFDLTV
ncbi:MAG: hypothetical protein II776_07110, partial [Clostridia bacterium]|nr:hypothetical protein [Clostridia bacterium]